MYFPSRKWPARRILSACACCVLLGTVLWGGRAVTGQCALTIALVDAETGAPLSGLLAIESADGKPLTPRELLPRGLGVEGNEPISRWSVLPRQMTLELPQVPFTLRALAGLETKLAELKLDLTGKPRAEVTLPVARFYRPAARGLRSGNTHLHLMKLSREQADRYLAEIPRADGLEVMFLSYLERAVADKDYISNRYTRADLERLTQTSGVIFGNGEEHRHNFPDKPEGYGHVMLLDIKELVLPVSIGPGIMKMGNDGLPLRRGIDTARQGGATIVWCHNEMGTENIPSWVTGRLQAQNIFDGSIRSSYKDSFYRYLNAGLKTPFSTGTDWFIYDFSRVYVTLNEPLSMRSWLRGLAQGKSYITNGPFLELEVAGRGVGDTVSLPASQPVEIVARGLGRVDFQRIEVILNGAVLRTQATKPADGHFVAELRFAVDVTEPCWFALRIPPPPMSKEPVPKDPELAAAVPLNELGQPLFAHTSAIDVTLAGRHVFDPRAAQELLTRMEHSIRYIEELGKFDDEQERARVLEVYADAIAALKQHIRERTL